MHKSVLLIEITLLILFQSDFDRDAADAVVKLPVAPAALVVELGRAGR